MAEPVQCRRCGRYIFEGDTGWYYQAPIQIDDRMGGTITFMDRITDCDDGEPHDPEKVQCECGAIVPNDENDILEHNAECRYDGISF